MADRFACPKCGTLCEWCGSIVDPSGTALAVYQCDEEGCQTVLELDGQAFPAAYTFAVGPDGKAFDPAVATDLRRN